VAGSAELPPPPILFVSECGSVLCRGVHGAVPPPAKPTNPRSGSQWHEIEHDGFRIIARESGAQVRPYNRPGIGQLVIGAAPYRKGAVTSPGRMFLQPGGRGAYPIPAD
jgi:hypothetical protein